MFCNVYLVVSLGILSLSQLTFSAEDWTSPCPRLFTYDTQNNVKGKWFGIVTLLSDSDLSGVWLRLIFDRPSIQLGNWFGQVDTTDNVEYLVKNRNHKLKSGTPHTLRFYIQYNENEPPPKLVSFRLNAKVVCPEGAVTTPAPSTVGELQTSLPLGVPAGTRAPAPLPPRPTQPTPAAVKPTPSPTDNNNFGGPIFGGGSTSEDDDFFPGDFGLLSNAGSGKPGSPVDSKPDFGVQCGTVVTHAIRAKRSPQYDPNFQHYHQPLPSYQYHHNTYSGNNGFSAWADEIIKLVEGLEKNNNNNNNVRTENRLYYPDDQLPIYNNYGQKVQPRPLITHGQATSEGEFPWHAALYHARGIDLAYICGGSLISKNHVMTVAHCVTKRKSSSPLNPDNLVVYLGKYYLKRWSNPGVQDRQVAAIIPHPQYNANSYSNDIALLKLAKSVDFTDYVRPVCLWEGHDDINHVLNQQGTVVGWGFDETGRVTEKLTQAKMPVVSKETCIYSFPDFFSRFTTTKTYCAGFRNGTSVCNGDSGGGMVFPKNPSGSPPVWVLRGLVSISVALQNQFRCDASHYVVFTDTAKYQDWIKQSMKV